jgi:phosphoribosylamine---glycine ligase
MPMRVLVVGSGGREHAMCRALAEAGGVDVLAAPGNPGTAQVARNLPVDDVDGIVSAAVSEAVDLVLPGPEAPLVLGLADALAAVSIPCCGPSAPAARLEGSKAFTRAVTAVAGVPSPGFTVVVDRSGVDDALTRFSAPPVVKADGLAAGKGVFLPETPGEARRLVIDLLGGMLGDAGRRVVLEERLYGVEASLFYACRETEVVVLPHARDHKRLEDGERGPNTGGMGAVSPNPMVDASLVDEVTASIVLPTLEAMAARGSPYSGFLFAGLMLTDDGPRLLEYNVRLGDPEAQAILPRISGGGFVDVVAWAAGIGDEEAPIPVEDPRSVCAVVLAADGYPGPPRTGDPIEVDPGLEGADRWLIHAATRLDDGTLVTAGGRVGAVVGRAESLERARLLAYEGVGLVRWEGMTYRGDIGDLGDDRR